MTAFNKDDFMNYGMYVHYMVEGDSKFVARFKYASSGKRSFITFLIKNFTVEEYFGRLAAGETPLTILQSKGYLQPHIKKYLKQLGYPVTSAGYERFIQDEIRSREVA